MPAVPPPPPAPEPRDDSARSRARRAVGVRDLLALATLAVLAVSGWWGYREQEFLRLNEEGVAALKAGRFADAERAFRGALGHRPARHALRVNLAVALEAQERYDEAIAEYDEVFKDTKDPKVDVYRWRARCGGGDVGQPMTVLFDLRLQHPGDREILLAEGTCRLRSGDLDAAVALLGEAVKLGAGGQAERALKAAEDALAAGFPATAH